MLGSTDDEMRVKTSSVRFDHCWWSQTSLGKSDWSWLSQTSSDKSDWRRRLSRVGPLWLGLSDGSGVESLLLDSTGEMVVSDLFTDNDVVSLPLSGLTGD